MGYSSKYDTSFNDETGEWLEKIGFCPEENACQYCKAYNEDGRPVTAFNAPERNNLNFPNSISLRNFKKP